MSNKKIITGSIIVAALLIAVSWFYSRKNPGPAAIVNQPASVVGGLIIGNDKAPVTIEEYTNFLCPACQNFAIKTLPLIKDNYIKSDKVKMVIYIFPPLEFGRAAYCSDKQNKFSEYHDYLFAHQREITAEQNIFDFAANVGINRAEFIACYNSEAAKKTAQAWLDAGKKRGVDATPIFYINGEKLIGAQPYREFKKIIDSKLSSK